MLVTWSTAVPSCTALKAIVTVLVALLLTDSAHAADSRRPNLLLLLTDDQRWDALGCTGHPHLKTPHIDRLAAEGVTFDNAFVTTAICCISRASIMTGQYARHHGVGDFATPLAKEVLARTFPTLLKQAGYRIGCLGKWGIGGPAPEALFDTWHAWGGQGEFFETIDGRQVHNSQMLADRASAFIRAGPADQPFCLVVYYKSPHDPYLPDPRDASLFANVTFPRAKTYSDEDFQSRPAFIRESEGRKRLQRGHPTPERYQEFVRQYLRCVAGVDRSVGEILAALDDTRQSKNTVVVYSSDNGFFLGEHGLSHKWLMYEESIRVPLIVRDPRLPVAARGKRRDELVLNIDLAPTLLDLAGLAPPREMDGRSLAPLVRGESPPWRDDFFYEHHYAQGVKIPRSEGIRTRDWKYIRYFDVDPTYEELYDLAHDKAEEHNLATSPQHADRLAALRARYEAHVKELPPLARPSR